MNRRKLWELGFDLPDDRIALLAEFQERVLRENQYMNLTAITDPEEFVIKHLADSLSVLKTEALQRAERVLDVGTGAGFPGIPLAIAAPEKEFVLIDALQKRVRFLARFIDEFGLKNVIALHVRAEELAREEYYRERFDCVVSRAVAELKILAEYCLPFAAVGGFFLAMKGPAVDEETADARYAIGTLGGRISNIVHFTIGEHERAVVVIKKEFCTPPQYPRRAGIPKKRPLTARAR